MKKIVIAFILFILAIQISYSQSKQLRTFPLSSVRLQEGSPFYQAQMVDMDYILALDPDRLLAPFLMDAGIETKAERYGNWENTGLDGHTGGHYLTALAQMYASTGNKKMRERLNYMIDQLEICQKKNGNGYVGGVPGGKAMWKEIEQGKINAASFSLNGKWVPWYNIHKLYAGLRDAYLIGGNQKAKEILINLSDWCLNLTSNLSEAQMQDMLRSEHGGMNEIFADVADITGDKKYLDMAKKFSHKAILNPLLEKKDALTGLHANTQIPKVIGFKRVADVTGENSWSEAANFFWQTVVENRSVSIGGNSVREHFHPANDFSSMIESNQGPETCNTYNMIRLSSALFLSDPDVKYMDYYERSLYNHILSSQHPSKGGFVYFTPMRPRHYRVYSQPDNNFWCCVGSGIENHGKYGELIYAHNDKDIFVNLFIPSALEWQEKGISLVQNTKFPFEETSEIIVNTKKSQRFALHIRYPSWLKTGEMKISVNGKNQKTTSSSAALSYVSIDRNWKNGDVVKITLPMHTEVENLPDNSPWVSFIHGPIVLAAATETTDLIGLFADDSRMGHVADGKFYPIDEAPILVTSDSDISSKIKPVPGKPLTFTMEELVYPDKYKNVLLTPFFGLHESRYMLYWPVTTPEGLEVKKKEMMEKEKVMLELEARTIDQVAPGEQQPESEHNFKGERTENGNYKGRFWRNARGWFSYELKDKGGEAKLLRITYSGEDRNRNFDIVINDTPVATVNLDGSKGDKFFDVDYKIPDEVLKKGEGTLTVKFIAKEGSIAGSIYGVRLLK